MIFLEIRTACPVKGERFFVETESAGFMKNLEKLLQILPICGKIIVVYPQEV